MGLARHNIFWHYTDQFLGSDNIRKQWPLTCFLNENIPVLIHLLHQAIIDLSPHWCVVLMEIASVHCSVSRNAYEPTVHMHRCAQTWSHSKGMISQCIHWLHCRWVWADWRTHTPRDFCYPDGWHGRFLVSNGPWLQTACLNLDHEYTKNVLQFLSISAHNLIWSNIVFQYRHHHSGFCGV